MLIIWSRIHTGQYHMLQNLCYLQVIGMVDFNIANGTDNVSTGKSVIPHPPWPLLISDVGLALEGTLKTAPYCSNV